MPKNPKQQTFEESGVTIQPYKSLPTKNIKCKIHDFERRQDNLGNSWLQCKKCMSLQPYTLKVIWRDI